MIHELSSNKAPIKTKQQHGRKLQDLLNQGPGFDPWNPQGGRRELSTSCPLTSISVQWHMHTLFYTNAMTF